VTADVINLNQARKAKAKKEALANAGIRRIKFGRDKGQSMAEKLGAERAKRTLDQHRLKSDTPETPKDG